jgi:hypothetical protein
LPAALTSGLLVALQQHRHQAALVKAAVAAAMNSSVVRFSARSGLQMPWLL